MKPSIVDIGFGSQFIHALAVCYGACDLEAMLCLPPA